MLTSKWHLKRKLGANGEIIKYQAHIVAYRLTIASVVRPSSYRILLHYELCHRTDFVTAFLAADLQERACLEPLEGFPEKDDERLVLQKSLYGLKQCLRKGFSNLRK